MTESSVPQIADLDVFIPRYTATVRVDGRDYGVLHPLDLSFEQRFKLVDLARKLDGGSGATGEEEFDAMVESILILVPEVSEESLRRRPARQIGELVARIESHMQQQVPAANPQQPNA